MAARSYYLLMRLAHMRRKLRPCGHRIPGARAAGVPLLAVALFLAASLIAQGAGMPPSITTQPANQAVNPGATATFSVTATGTAPLSFQWLFNGTNLTGATNASLFLTNIASTQYGPYAVQVTNSAGSTTSSNAQLTPVSALINIDFAGSAQNPEVGPAATGQTANDYWNELNVGATTATNLQFAGGGGSGSGLSLTHLTGGYVLNTSDPMYNTYTYLSGGNFALTVTNLPPGGYDVYIYGHGNANNQNGTYSLAVGGINYGTNSTVNGTGWQSSVWQEGVQYVVFGNVTITNSAQVLTITAYQGAGGYAVINGMQIADATALAPSITQQPVPVTAGPGATATFQVGAIGAPPLSYQWLFYGTNLPGATNAVLTLTNLQAGQAGPYAAVVTNLYGSATSSNAVLTFPPPPSITGQPQDQSVLIGGTAGFSVTGTGTPPLSYQWLFYGTNLPGATSSSLTLTNVQAGQAGPYAVVFSDAYGSVLSSNAMLSLLPTPPSITTQPQSQTVGLGTPASFAVGAQGTAPLSYQWLFNGAALTGATNATLTITNVQSAQAGPFAVQVTNAFGATASSNATLAIAGPLINIDFAGDAQHPEVGPAAAGASTNDYWNPMNVGATSLTGLRFASGAVSGGGVLVSVATSGFVLNASDEMYNTYDYSQSAFTITLTNVPGSYDVYVYGHGNANNQYGTYSLAVDSVNYGTKSTVNGPGWQSSVWQEGVQYVVFHNVTVNNSAQVLTITVSPDANGYSVINGMQLVGLNQAPAFTQQPQSTNAQLGGLATFSPVVAGTPPLAFQWLFNGTNLPGATNQSLILTNLQFSQAGPYALQVTNGYGSALSSNATLAVVPVIPLITTQPQSQSVPLGGTATFSVTAAGTAPLAYQWLFNGTNLSGATDASLIITNVQPGQVGPYAVQVTNAYGLTTSSNATLAIAGPLINIDFAGDTVNPEIGPAATGLGTNDYWNPLGVGATSLANLLFSDGTVSGCGLQLSSSPSGFVLHLPDPMYNTYDYEQTSFTTTVTNPPPGSYDIYVYGHGNADNQYGSCSVSVDSVNYGTNSTVNGPGWQSSVWQLGVQYVVFHNVTINNSAQVLTITSYVDAGGYSVVNGMQLVGLNQAPAFTQQPQSTSVQIGGLATFNPGVTGSPPLAFQWLFNGTNLPGATNAVLNLTNVQSSQAGPYALQVTNVFGATLSSNATLTVTPEAPLITTQPRNQTVQLGATAAFSVTATGIAPLSYQWLFNGTNLSGATGTSLTLTNVQVGQAGTYAVEVTDASSSTLSSNATLSIGIPLINVDVAGSAQTPEVGPAATGLGPNDYWNPLNVGATSLPNLRFADGTVSDCGIQLSSRPSGFVLHLPDSMYNTYDYETVNFSISLTNLPPGNYDIYIYGHGNQDNQYGSYSLSVDGLNYGTNSTVNGTGWQSSVWQAGVQYVVFGVVPITNSAQVLTITSYVDAGGYSMVNGLQIMAATNLAPVITAQPAPVTVGAGQTAVFNVGTAGLTPFGYQWLLEGTNLPDATNASLSLTNVQFGQAGNYSVQVTNPYGAALSSNALLTVLTPPAITTQPASETVLEGTTASFSVTATGDAPLHYQWEFNGTNLPGATTTVLNITSVRTNQAGSYSVLVSNLYGSVLSSNATLTVTPAPPSITTQPQDQTVAAGATSTFSVVAAGDAPLAYQWLFNTTNLPGATSATLTITNSQADQAGTYAVFVTNLYGTVLSSNATLAIIPGPPSITTQPLGENVAAGSTVVFSVTATGTSPLGYQWLFNGTNLPGATDASLALTNVQADVAGVYAVGVTNAYGATVSSNATLSIISALLNIDLAGDTVNPEVGPAAIGLATNDYWNPVGVGATSLPGLLLSDGTFSGVGIQLSSGPSGFVLHLPDPMYNTYDYEHSSFTMTVTNLPPGSYDLYLYGHGNVDNQCGTYSVSVDNVNYGTNSTVNGPGWASPVWQEGVQYVVFRGVTLTNFGQVVLVTVNVDAAGYSLINGMQIAELAAMPPAITQQPQSGSVASGAAATLNVGVFGSPPLGYQWLFDGTNLVDATNASLLLPDVQLDQAGTYAVVVTNIYGSVLSSNATLAVNTSPPSITTQPADQSAAPGATAVFNVTVAGSAPLSYQWLFNGADLPGATNASLTLANTRPDQGGTYALQVTNAYGATVSSNATLSIISALINVDFAGDSGHPEVGPAAIGLTSSDYWNPLNVGATSLPGLLQSDGTLSGAGVQLSSGPSGFVLHLPDPMYNTYDYEPTSFTIAVTNLPPGGYDFYIYGHGNVDNQCGGYTVSVDGVSQGTLATVNGPGWASPVWQEGVQYVVFRGVTLTSSAQVVLITANLDAAGYSLINGMQIAELAAMPPAITQQPRSALAMGGDASFNVAAVGTKSLGYQWLYNGKGLPTATNSTLMLHNAGPAQAGTYAVVVSNPYGSVMSSQAVLNTLGAKVSGPGLTLTWPVATGGFVLQSATNLAPPIVWTTVPNVPTTNGSACVLTLPIVPGGAMFYRLSPSP